MKATVIGCGRMGVFTSETVRRFAPRCWFPLAHADAVVASSNVSLSALCDPDADALARAADAHPGVSTFTDHHEMLKALTPDIAFIATRTPGRARIICDLAAAGTRAFHIEKPLCNSVAELATMDALLGQGDIFATYGTIRRFFATVRHAVHLADSGQFGALCEIRVNMGRGTLFWTHPHSIDLILFAAGDRVVRSVQAVLPSVDQASVIVEEDPEVAAATIWFEGGVAGHIGRTAGADLFLGCERGTISVTRDGADVIVEEMLGSSPYPIRRSEIVPAPLLNDPCGTLAPLVQLANCLGHDRHAIEANARVKRDILRGQRLSFAMVQSGRRRGAIVAPDNLDSELTVWAKSGVYHA